MNINRCSKCGCFLSKNKEHICKNVDLKGDRFCNLCGKKLRNDNHERYANKCSSCARKIQRENERQLKLELIEIFGGKCKKCGYNKYNECLEFHHLFKEDKKNKHFLKEVLKHPERFELYCNRCHREEEIELKIKNKNEN